MKIERYISELLFRHQCVIVPGLGGFLAEIRSAIIDGRRGLCLPPTKSISFNVNLRFNDGLLTTHIARTEKIDYDSALNLIRAEVSFIQDQLSAKQSVELNNIGVLSQTAFGTLQFEPVKKVNYYTAAFGLSEVNIPKSYVEAAIAEPISEPKVVALEAEARTKFNAWKYASAAVLLLGLSAYFANNQYNTYVEEQTAEVREAVQKQVTAEIQKATFTISNPSETLSMPITSQQYHYHVVAGAFREIKNARAVLSDLKTRGFEARLLPKNQFGLTPVLFGSYRTYGEAKAALSQIHDTQTDDAWLLVD